MQLKKQTGFTLVEIAIVLVIVGLLIGGVLKGQEMITNAKLKRIESDNAVLPRRCFPTRIAICNYPVMTATPAGALTFISTVLPPPLTATAMD